MPYLTPKEDPLDTTCRQLQIPADTEWIGIIGGALTELLKLHNWEQSSGGITREQAVARIWAMMNLYWDSDCEGCATRRIFRISFEGKIQFSDDIGETWTDAEDTIIEPLPPRPELTDDERECMAAANAAHVLHLTYQELLVAFETDSSISYGIGVFAAILGLLLAAIWLPLAFITALINFALGAFGAAWAGLQFLADNDWTVTFHEDFICLLKDNATVTGGIVTFDYMAVRDNVIELEGDNALKFWLFYILQVIGAEGLNAAGATTAVESHVCNCIHEQCWTFSELEPGWSFLPTESAPAGSILATDGNPQPCANGTFSGAPARVFGVTLRYEFDAPVRVRRASFDYRYNRSPSHTPGIYRAVRFYDAAGAQITRTDATDTPSQNTWHNWGRNVDVANVKSLQFQVGGSSPATTSGNARIDNVCLEWME